MSTTRNDCRKSDFEYKTSIVRGTKCGGALHTVASGARRITLYNILFIYIVDGGGCQT